VKIFKLSKELSVVCNSKKTRNGFKHEASLCRSGRDISTAKICYYNRTWEAFEYESVLRKIIKANFAGKDQKKYLNKIKLVDSRRASPLKSAAVVAGLGNMLCKTLKEKNAWKKRMLSTQQGLNFPEDFDNLPEKEKERRLDGVIKIANDQNPKR